MRKILFGIGALVAAGAIAVAALYLRGDLFRSASRPAQQSSWVPVPHPPGDRPKPELALIREFGAWHLSCTKQAEQPPKVGFIQNLGIAPNETKRFSPCHVFIMMRDSAVPGQTMLMNFRYRAGFTAPDLVIIYTTLDKPHVIYDRTGDIHDLSQKKVKWRGGFFRDPKKAPLRANPQVQSQSIPVIGVQLGPRTLTIQTQACIKAHCFGRLMSTQTGAIGSVSRIVVRLPGPPRGQPRVIDVPADGLELALAELKRMAAS
jgi:hypothetical protein